MAVRCAVPRSDAGPGTEVEVITYSATISACKKNKSWQRALQSLDPMRAPGTVANVQRHHQRLLMAPVAAARSTALGS